ncbi:MAG: MBL fold metallo-hydrolase [Candidatus Nanoarchaeia archaeon]|nr:MBL fold metallo-hydrolase [Candidatus Nanoarchaeia archaeon]MDD5499776.1 MBL fold metallo-hydrolase [Candidatus Nanoarchaeia archaeon]
MNVIPLCFDSMGARSSCVFVQCEGLNILIDPNLALANTRMGFCPSDDEMNAFFDFKKRIVDFAKRSDIIIVTHYHNGHYISSQDEFFEEVYGNKIVLCKDRSKKLDLNQRNKGKEFEITVKKICKEYLIADNNSFSFKNAKISFSEPVWHGAERTQNGYVVMVSVSEKKFKFMYSSDIYGPILESTADLIIKENPDLLYLCSAPTHLLGYGITESDLFFIEKNIKKIIDKSKAVKTIIYDHYLLRDKDYLKYFSKYASWAKAKKKRFITAAEFLGQPVNQLEVKRTLVNNEY